MAYPILLLPPPLCGASYNTCPHQMPANGVYIWHPPSPPPSSPFVVLHIIPVLIRCQSVGFTYGIPPSPPAPFPFVVLHIIPVLIRCQAVGFTYGIPTSPPPSLPLCGASYNTCPHQMPGSGVYIWNPSFFSSLPSPLWCFI